jgi:pyruvate ferredoxin oxidoreductase alpha subunit
MELMPLVAGEFEQVFGRTAGGLISRYRCDDADTLVVALGSVLGTIKDTVDDLRNDGESIGAIGITSFRPFPIAALRAALLQARRVVVVEKCFAVGIGGIVSRDVRMALRDRPQPVVTVVAGLGGRAITQASLRRVFLAAMADQLEPLNFLDLDWSIVNRVLEREKQTRRSGPVAEGVLRDIGTVASRIG